MLSMLLSLAVICFIPNLWGVCIMRRCWGRVRKLVVEITPEGYSLSKRCFKTLPEMLKWFKTNASQLTRTSRRSSHVRLGVSYRVLCEFSDIVSVFPN